MGAASGEQCRGACSEVLPEEIKEAAPGLVRDGGVVRVERLVDADRLLDHANWRLGNLF